MALQHLKEGYDPTADVCVTTSMLLQMIRNAQPFPDDGFVHWAAAAPDVVANPELARFLWGVTVAGVRTRDIYFHNGTTWELLTLDILLNSITLDKLSGTGAIAFDIIQRNSANTAFIFTQIVNAIPNGSLPPAKLAAVADAANYVLTSLSGVSAWTAFTTFLAAIADNSIPIDKLVRGAANTFLRVNAAGTALEWTTVAITDILAPTYVAGQAARRNSGNTGWEAFTPISATGLSKSFISGGLAVPVTPVFTTAPVAHGLATVPTVVGGRLVCVADQHGYTIGDVIDLATVVARGSDDDFHINVVADGTNIQALVPISPGTYQIYITHKTTGAAQIITAANWNIRLHCFV